MHTSFFIILDYRLLKLILLRDHTILVMSHSSTSAVLSKLSQGESICFKYSGGSWPGVPRNLFFHSWYVAGPVRGEYMTAYDTNGNFKTFHCSKISELISTSHSNSEKEEVSKNDFSNWTSWIKEGDIIEFLYNGDQSHGGTRNVTFVNFMNRRCSKKRKILCYENGYTKTFFIDKMVIHKIFEVDKKYDEEDSVCSPQELHSKVNQLETKQNLIIKELKARIDTQNTMIEKFKERMFLLEEDCIHLEEEKKEAYIIMTIHKRRYPSTWESDFVPKELSDWELINSPTS